jgi:imidazolonepropionase
MTETMWDAIWINARLATMVGQGWGTVEEAAIGVADGLITYCGPMTGLPKPADQLARLVHDAEERWITPGLVDCHTHLVWGGDRAREFEMRLEGATYEQIARAGGGIRSTVAATRAASEADLFHAAATRLSALMAEGVTTVEIKSGYGLDVATESKCLRVARRLGAVFPVTVKTTFLGAHAVPPEFDGNADGYMTDVIERQLPAIVQENLADAVDAFCEGIGFSAAQTERLFDAAKAHGLPVKLHAEQLSDLNGAALAARYGALSADHLEWLSDAGVAAMAQAGTVAVLLPGAFYFLRETKLPPIAALRAAGVPLALATDCNPGSSPLLSPLLTMNMACTLFRMTPAEALAGFTREGARALGMGDTHGVLAVGKAADFVAWDIESPAELAYIMGARPTAFVVHGGSARI